MFDPLILIFSRREKELATSSRKHVPAPFLIGHPGDISALLLGVLMPLAFAPYSYAWIAVLSPALLFLLWEHITPRRAFWRGWLYGLGMFGVGISWVQISIHQFGLPVLTFSASVTLLLIAYLALYPALTGYLACRFGRNDKHLHLLLLTPALWSLSEWVRSWALTGLPWLNIGYSQIDTPISAYAPLLGIYGVGFTTVFSAAAILYSLRSRRFITGFLLIALIWGGGWGLSKMLWTHPLDGSLRVALIQGNIPQRIKWLPEQRIASIQQYFRLSSPYIGKTDLILWPETAVPAFYHTVPDVIETLVQRTAGTGSTILTGIAYRDPASGRYLNSLVQLGEEPHFYHKRHLVPFGEYMPFKSTLGKLLTFLDIPMSDFSAGDARQPLFKIRNHPIAASICYEDVFGEEVITSLPAAQILINISNDAWFGDSLAPHQHLQMARMRALETGRWLLRATNTGISAIIDARGKIVAQSPQFKPHALVATVAPYTGTTPYVLVGNYGILVLLILQAGIYTFYVYRSQRDTTATSA